MITINYTIDLLIMEDFNENKLEMYDDVIILKTKTNINNSMYTRLSIFCQIIPMMYNIKDKEYYMYPDPNSNNFNKDIDHKIKFEDYELKYYTISINVTNYKKFIDDSIEEREINTNDKWEKKNVERRIKLWKYTYEYKVNTLPTKDELLDTIKNDLEKDLKISEKWKSISVDEKIIKS